MSGSVQNLASASTALNSVEANSNKEFNQPKVEKSKTSLSGRQVTFLVGAVVLGTVALVSAAALAAIFVPPVAAAIPAIALGGVTLLLGLQLTLGTAAVVSGLGALVLLAGSLFKGSKANEESKDLSSQRPFSQEADIDLGKDYVDPRKESLDGYTRVSTTTEDANGFLTRTVRFAPAPAPAAHSSSSSVSKTNEQQDTVTHLSSPSKINDESSTVSVSAHTTTSNIHRNKNIILSSISVNPGFINAINAVGQDARSIISGLSSQAQFQPLCRELLQINKAIQKINARALTQTIGKAPAAAPAISSSSSASNTDIKEDESVPPKRDTSVPVTGKNAKKRAAREAAKAASAK